MLTLTHVSQIHCSPQQRSIKFILFKILNQLFSFQNFPKRKFQMFLAETMKTTFSLFLDEKNYF